jgi:hypothetical protein
VTVSVVLRLAPAALAAGRLAGEAELVATGERATVRNAEELVRFVARSSATAGAPAPQARVVESERRGG